MEESTSRSGRDRRIDVHSGGGYYRQPSLSAVEVHPHSRRTLRRRRRCFFQSSHPPIAHPTVTPYSTTRRRNSYPRSRRGAALIRRRCNQAAQEVELIQYERPIRCFESETASTGSDRSRLWEVSRFQGQGTQSTSSSASLSSSSSLVPTSSTTNPNPPSRHPWLTCTSHLVRGGTPNLLPLPKTRPRLSLRSFRRRHDEARVLETRTLRQSTATRERDRDSRRDALWHRHGSDRNPGASTTWYGYQKRTERVQLAIRAAASVYLRPATRPRPPHGQRSPRGLSPDAV